jgi:cation transport ATPase
VDGFNTLRRGAPNMNTLVSLGAIASFSVRAHILCLCQANGAVPPT